MCDFFPPDQRLTVQFFCSGRSCFFCGDFVLQALYFESVFVRCGISTHQKQLYIRKILRRKGFESQKQRFVLFMAHIGESFHIGDLSSAFNCKVEALISMVFICMHMIVICTCLTASCIRLFGNFAPAWLNGWGSRPEMLFACHGIGYQKRRVQWIFWADYRVTSLVILHFQTFFVMHIITSSCKSDE